MKYSLREVEMIKDQKLLAKIAQNASNSDVVRVVATANLEDQAVLGEIALYDTYWSVRECAILKLKDSSVLRMVARCDNCWRLRIIAENRLRWVLRSIGI